MEGQPTASLITMNILVSTHTAHVNRTNGTVPHHEAPGLEYSPAHKVLDNIHKDRFVSLQCISWGWINDNFISVSQQHCYYYCHYSRSRTLRTFLLTYEELYDPGKGRTAFRLIFSSVIRCIHSPRFQFSFDRRDTRGRCCHTVFMSFWPSLMLQQENPIRCNSFAMNHCDSPRSMVSTSNIIATVMIFIALLWNRPPYDKSAR